MEFNMKLRKHKTEIRTLHSASSKVAKAPVKKRSKTRACGACVCKTACKTCDLAEYPQIWTEFREKNQLCDGIVRCQDGLEFKIHRVILSSISPYFKALFTNSINRTSTEIHETNIAVPSDVFKKFLDYAYTGHCGVDMANVEKIIMYADQFEILGIVQQCCELIIGKLEVKNCLSVLNFARQYFCQELEKKGKRFIRRNFKQVALQNEDFKKMDVDELLELLEDDELNVQNEGCVFEAIQIWIDENPQERKKYAYKLAQSIRFGNMSLTYYNDVVRPWLSALDRQFKTFLLDVDRILNKITEQEIQKVDPWCQFRRPRIPNQLLFVVGGWSAGSPTNFVETYDNRADKWLLSRDTDFVPRAYHGLCAMRGLVYMIGGFDGNEHFNTVRCFNPSSRIWKECACMYYPRCYVSVVVYDDKIYALGGYSGRVRMSSAERYDPDSNQWELIPPMQQQRSDASAAALNHKIYIVGGFNGVEVMNSAEFYDTVSNQWTYIPSMMTARSGVSLLAFKNALYALGGFNGFNRLTSCEKIVPGQMPEWTPIMDMFCPRSNFATAILDNTIYAIGGFNGSTTIAYVECFDPENNEWSDAAPMNLNRSALSACVLSNLDNAKEYSFLGCPNAPQGEEGARGLNEIGDMMLMG